MNAATADPSRMRCARPSAAAAARTTSTAAPGSSWNTCGPSFSRETPASARRSLAAKHDSESTPMTTRRQFLRRAATAGAALLGARAGADVIDPPGSPKKVAAIVTAYFRYSHADNIVTRFMEGYSIVGKSYPPPCRVASLYIDQVDDQDIGRPLAKRWNVPLSTSIHEALTLGGDKLA